MPLSYSMRIFPRMYFPHGTKKTNAKPAFCIGHTKPTVKSSSSYQISNREWHIITLCCRDSDQISIEYIIRILLSFYRISLCLSISLHRKLPHAWKASKNKDPATGPDLCCNYYFVLWGAEPSCNGKAASPIVNRRWTSPILPLLFSGIGFRCWLRILASEKTSKYPMQTCCFVTFRRFSGSFEKQNLKIADVWWPVWRVLSS